MWTKVEFSWGKRCKFDKINVSLIFVSQRSNTDPHFTGNCIVGGFFIVFSLKTRLLKNLTAYCLKEYNKFEIFLVILGNHFMVSGRITYEYSRNIYIYEKKVYTWDFRKCRAICLNVNIYFFLDGNMYMYMGNEILEISRIESGQTKLDEAVCNLEDIIKKQILSSGIRRRKHLQTLYLLKIKNPATLKRGWKTKHSLV